MLVTPISPTRTPGRTPGSPPPYSLAAPPPSRTSASPLIPAPGTNTIRPRTRARRATLSTSASTSALPALRASELRPLSCPLSPTRHSRPDTPPAYTHVPNPPDDDEGLSDREEDPTGDPLMTRSTLPRSASSGLRARLTHALNPSSSTRDPVLRTINTGRGGVLCAGETETEGENDVLSARLPTSRVPSTTSPILIPPDPQSLEAKLTPWLFELSRLLSVVPAILGVLHNLYHIVSPPQTSTSPRAIEYYTSIIWCLLTATQCLRLTTGLLQRWRLYYAPLSTLIRLLALQAICWPATHFTLKILESGIRPSVCWMVIGCTTCCSRAVQIWVTSNLALPSEPSSSLSSSSSSSPTGSASTTTAIHDLGLGRVRVASGEDGPLVGEKMSASQLRVRRRRWDWDEVLWQAGVPMGVCYVIMAWMEVWDREMRRGNGTGSGC